MGKDPLPYTDTQIAFSPQVYPVPTVLSDCIGVSTTAAESDDSHVPDTIFKGPMSNEAMVKAYYSSEHNWEFSDVGKLILATSSIL